MTPTLSASTGIVTFRSANGLAADGSQDLLTPAGDGVTNLLKFAFNMIGAGVGQVPTLTVPNSVTLSPGGSAGMPFATVETGTDKLTITFIRRKLTSNSGITYQIEFSEDLITWAVNSSAVESSTSLDAVFERMVVTDSASFPKRFVRVKVSHP